jgi:hypothetical protein
MISQEMLKARLHYNPDTGDWTWVEHPWFKSYAGRPVAGNRDKDGYARVSINDKNVKLHRLAFLFMLGEMPPAEVDHINGDKTDNRWCNLRLAERAQNGQNIRDSGRNTSGIIGVNWNNHEQKWQVRVMAFGTRHSGGYFSDINAAIAKRDQMVKELHAEFGVLQGVTP